jgi:hypothetical protein
MPPNEIKAHKPISAIRIQSPAQIGLISAAGGVLVLGFAMELSGSSMIIG